MRILYLKEHTKRGVGDSHSMVHQMRALRDRGHVQVLLTGWTDMKEELDVLGIPVHTGVLDNDRKGLFNGLRGILEIRKVAREERIDVLHAHHRWAGLLGWAASRTLNLPIVHTDHLALYGMKALSYRGDAVIAVSESGATHLESYFHVPREKIEVVLPFYRTPLPPGPDAVTRLRREIGIGDDALCVGRLASLIPNKAPDVMLAAFAKVRSQVNNAHLIMAGAGPLLEPLKVQASRLGITTEVHWLGLRDDTSTVLGMLDVFSLSSNREGTPLAIMEAMALGVPVVSTAVGGVPTLLDNGRYGLLVRPQDPDALAAAVTSLLLDEHRREQYAMAAKERVRTYCAPEVLAERVERVYEQVCAPYLVPRRGPEG